MSKITVTVRSDNGDLGTHHKYGRLVPGTTLVIDEADFGEQLFVRAAQPKTKAEATPAAPASKGGKKEEVNDHA